MQYEVHSSHDIFLHKTWHRNQIELLNTNSSLHEMREKEEHIKLHSEWKKNPERETFSEIIDAISSRSQCHGGENTQETQ